MQWSIFTRMSWPQSPILIDEAPHLFVCFPAPFQVPICVGAAGDLAIAGPGACGRRAGAPLSSRGDMVGLRIWPERGLA